MKKIAYVSLVDCNLYGFRLPWMRALLALGCDVCAVVPEGEYGPALRKEGIRVVPYPMVRRSLNPISGLATVRRLQQIFKHERFDLVHSFTLKPNLYSSLAGALSRTPVVNHVTGLGYFYTEGGLKTRLVRFLISTMYWLSFRSARRVVFQNPDDLKALQRLVDARKAVLIKGTGVDTEFFAPRPEDARKALLTRRALGLSEDAVVVTFIGRLSAHKGIREFVEAAQIISTRNPRSEFLVIGWIDEENPAAVTRTFVDEASLLSHIHFVGKRDDVRNMLAATDILALPSYSEGTPRSVLEAMAMAKPVVTTDVRGCRQTVDDGVNGFLVPPRDSHKLATAIETLIADAPLRIRMGRAGRKKAIELFSNDVVIPQILDLYSQLTESAEPR